MAVEAAALIVMTILGCDDSVSQCHYISTVNGTWQSVAVCDAESQKQLPKFSNASYPVVVAMCEKSGKEITAAVDPAPVPLATPTLAQPAVTPTAVVEEKPALPRRALSLVTGALPDRERLRQVVSAPVHYIENSYSWVARKFTN